MVEIHERQITLPTNDYQKPKKKKPSIYWSFFILPITFFYYECLFRIATKNTLFSYAMIPILLFSCGYGLIGYYLVTLSGNPRINRLIRLLIMLLTAVPFLVEYFIYRQFKVMYDLNTIFNGASDVIGSNFLGDALRMIFSPTGLLVIVLMFLPAVLYGVFGKRIDRGYRGTAQTRIMVLAMFLAVVICTLITTGLPRHYRETYRKSYQFESAISHFGLMTGLRLEIVHAIGGRGTSFEMDGSDNQTSASSGSEEPDAPEEPKVYPKNELPLDFAALASAAPNRTVRNMDEYVASLTASSQNEYTGLFKGKNLIFISAEAFSAEAIDPERTPTLYRMATRGINFTDYYQPASAGTTGGEVQNIFGMLPLSGGSTFSKLAKHSNRYTMSWQLNELGYYGKAFHNNTYTYYNRHITHNKLSFSEGFEGYGNGAESYITQTWPQSDLEMAQGTIEQYINKEHFNIYYMSVSGHSAYSWSANAMAKKNREFVAKEEESGLYSEPVLAYLACNVELDRAMEHVINQLEAAGKAEDTVIVISADHFPYGLNESGKTSYLAELYGYEPANQIERDHNRLILWCGALEKEEPIVVDSPTSSLDILPTLMNLFGIPFDSRLCLGRDVFSDADALVYNTAYDWKTELGTYIAAKGKFTPATEDCEIPDDYVDSVKKIVRNKMNYNQGLIDCDYFAHVFADPAS